MVRARSISMAMGRGPGSGMGASTVPFSFIRSTPIGYWESELGRNDFSLWTVRGELTVDGLSDREVCIGDRYRIGSALFEVTQPRVTCYRVGIRMNEPRMAALLTSHGRPGFYLRVLEEGQVEAGDEIVQAGLGSERMTVFEINALLYMPGHPRSEIERAVRIPALSAGWRGSFEALLAQERSGGATTGNAGVAPVSGPPPAWAGFRPLRVSRKNCDSSSVMSLMLEPMDGLPLTAALPGQFVVLRLKPALGTPPLMRSYSLSGEPSARCYRLSVKREPHGLAGAYIDERVQIGDMLEVSAPRGNFTLRQGDVPVVFLSAGIGATPVIAMLHALAAETSPREVWWLYGARRGREHPFSQEARTLLKALAHGHSHIRYSAPATIGTGDMFAKGRDFGAWLGMVPKQLSTGGRTILGKISKRGNKYLRTLFVQAARVVLLKRVSWERYGLKAWIEAAARRLHPNKLAIALANKLARIAWAVLHYGRNFEVSHDYAPQPA